MGHIQVSRHFVLWFKLFLSRQIRVSKAPRVLAAKRWEKSPYGTIFPNDRSASPTVGKPSLHSHDVLPTVGLDAFLSGENSLRNDDQAERSLVASIDKNNV